MSGYGGFDCRGFAVHSVEINCNLRGQCGTVDLSRSPLIRLYL